MLRWTLAALVLVLAGCGGDDSSSSWSGPGELRPRSGVLEVDAFQEYAEDVDEDWERDPEQLAREFLQIDDGVVSIDGVKIVLLRDNLEDDSVRAERWVLDLESDGDVLRLDAAEWGQRCHRGRGHQEFSPELCV